MSRSEECHLMPPASKRQDEALLESAELSRRIIESSRDCIQALELDGRLLSLNPGGQRLLEIDDIQSVLGRNWIDFFEGEDHARAAEAFSMARQGGVGKFQAFRPSMKGVPRWWDVTITPLLDAEGRPERLMAISRDVTELKQAEEALRESLRDLNHAEALAHTGNWRLDMQRNTLRWSDETHRMFKIPPGTPLTYESFLAAIHPDDRDYVDQRWQAALLGAPYDIEHRIIVDGESRWVRERAELEFGPDGALLGGFGMVQDITERKRAEEAQRKSEARLRMALEAARAGVWEKDLENNTLAWTPENYEMYGIDPSEALTPEAWERNLHPDDLAMAKLAIRDTLERRSPEYRAEFRVRHPRLGLRWILGLGRVEFSTGGTPKRISGLNIDITERKEAEEALRESEQRFRALFDHSADAVFLSVPDGRIMAANPAACAMFGMTEEEIRQAGREGLMDMEDPRHAAAFEERRRTGRISNVELTFKRKDGRKFPGEVSSVILPGEPLQAFVTIRDITERKEAEEALREANAQLREADRRKDEFLAMLAHELRNPLAPIRSAAHILRAIGSQDPAAVRQEDVIDRQVTHMARLLDDLLDVSRVTRGKITLQKEPLALLDVLAHAMETAAPLIQSRRHELLFIKPPESLRIEGDIDRLAQIIGNLLANAAKYTETGGRIWLEAGRQGACAVIRVRDTGVGIAPEMLPRVFDLFAQADISLDRSQGGLGIGLTMVQRLTQLHGGSVEAHSEGVGRGSEFIVRLPALPEAKNEAELESSRAETSPNAARSRRVLVVDDVADSAESLAELLEIWGHQAQVAHDGRSALEIARIFQPTAALLDIGMPGMDGLALARHLRAEHHDRVFLIALTGYGQPQDREETRAAGFDAHLVKPVDLEELQRLLALERE